MASPARSWASRSSVRVPSASTTALSSAGDEPGGIASAGPAKNRPGIFAVWVGFWRVTGRNAGYRSVAPTPRGELGEIIVGHVIPDRLSHNLMQPVDVVDLAQRHPISSSPRSHQCDIADRHRPGTVVAPVGSPPRYRRGKRYIDGNRRSSGTIRSRQGDWGRPDWAGESPSRATRPPRKQRRSDSAPHRNSRSDLGHRGRCWAVAGSTSA